jgi:hypothetical protein
MIHAMSDSSAPWAAPGVPPSPHPGTGQPGAGQSGTGGPDRPLSSPRPWPEPTPWPAPGQPAALPAAGAPAFPVFSADPATPGQPGFGAAVPGRPGASGGPLVGHSEQLAPLTGWRADGGPAVPSGPGAQAPFPVAPSEGRGKRLGWAWAVAVLAVVLCCGGGLVAGGGLLIAGVQAVNEQADSVMNQYLTAIRDEEYQTAYDLLCDRIQKQETVESFTDSVESGPRLTGFEIGTLEVTNNLQVPVTETYADNSRAELTYTLFQDSGTGKLEVCGSR